MTKKDQKIETILIALIFSMTFTMQILVITELSQKSGLQFVDEDLIFTVNGTIASVNARYAMLNHETNNQFLISLPFAKKPWNVSLSFNGEALGFIWSVTKLPDYPTYFDCINFQIDLEQNEKADIVVTYERLFDVITEDDPDTGSLKYIVGSTQSWDYPLEFAHFELWQYNGTELNLLETRHFTNWWPPEMFLIFTFEII
ncbi:MAG: hypothetical protein ACTSO7_04535 [Candidatus Heimdallarchaeota archaeon]